MNSIDFQSGLEPLFNLSAARFRIGFEAKKPWRISEGVAAFRGKLGYELKRSLCSFKEFRGSDCRECAIQPSCGYVALFDPVGGEAEVSPDGQLKTARATARPFVFTLNGVGEKETIEPGDGGFLDLTLFGNAVELREPFVESAASALSRFPVKLDQIYLMTPAPSEHQAVSWTLTDWIESRKADFIDRFGGIKQNSDAVLTLRFLTPTRITKEGRIGAESMTFDILVKSLLRRIRDLKRAFGSDTHMGRVDKAFYRTAEAVSVIENHLYWEKQSRPSHRQRRDVFLDGIKGRISFKGQIQPFLSLLIAGEIAHIGKSVTNGCGRMTIERVQEGSSQGQDTKIYPE